MEDPLREKLQRKGARCNLQFPTQVREYLERECGFTDEEQMILRMRARGMTIVQISFAMQEETGKYYGTETIESRMAAEWWTGKHSRRRKRRGQSGKQT